MINNIQRITKFYKNINESSDSWFWNLASHQCDLELCRTPRLRVIYIFPMFVVFFPLILISSSLINTTHSYNILLGYVTLTIHTHSYVCQVILYVEMTLIYCSFQIFVSSFTHLSSLLVTCMLNSYSSQLWICIKLCFTSLKLVQ